MILRIEERVAELLTALNLKVATAESCTGGGLAASLTSISGSSSYFVGGIVAYANEIKINILGVDADLLKKCGAVSREVAIEMAKGAMKTLKTDIGISTTGVAGPTGGTALKPVGLIWIAIAYKDEIFTLCQEENEGRLRNTEKAIENALFLLLKILEKRKNAIIQ